MNDYTFGNFLYELRTEKGLSQNDLGKIMGVSNKAVSKWEMGVSKPSHSMLVTLASFFGVTVDELLAGKRNEQKAQEREERDDTVLKSWTDEYRKKKRRGANAVITACLLPVLLFVWIGVIVGINLEDTIIGPIVTMAIFIAEAIDIALIFVFYGSARRLKRMLYAAYPEQTKKITAMISPNRERRPFLKWEKICIITGAAVALVCNGIRMIIRYCAEQNKTVYYIDGVLLLLISLALLLEGIVLILYAIKNRRKK